MKGSNTRSQPINEIRTKMWFDLGSERPTIQPGSLTFKTYRSVGSVDVMSQGACDGSGSLPAPGGALRLPRNGGPLPLDLPDSASPTAADGVKAVSRRRWRAAPALRPADPCSTSLLLPGEDRALLSPSFARRIGLLRRDTSPGASGQVGGGREQQCGVRDLGLERGHVPAKSEIPGLLRAAQLRAGADRDVERSTAAATAGDAGRKSENSERAGAGRAGAATAAARRLRRYGGRAKRGNPSQPGNF